MLWILHYQLVVGIKIHADYTAQTRVDRAMYRKTLYVLQLVTSILVISLFYPTFLLYVFSRVYLVVDSFLQLAHLPDAVYQVPNWSQYFPHII